MKRVLYLALVASLLPVAARAADCDRASLDRAAQAVHATRAGMLHLPTGDGLQTDVSPAAQRLIAAMKTNLRAVIVAAMLCEDDSDPKAIVATLTRLAGAKAGDKDDRYGGSVDFAAKRVGPNLMAVTTGFAIECSGDTMLLVFASVSGGGWSEVLHIQSRPYETVSGAYEFFDYGISRPDPAGKWFVVIKNIAPWCSSTWSTIHYAAYRPSADPMRPHQLFEGSDPVWWGAEDEHLTVGRYDFLVRFHAQSIDLGVHNRIWVRHFAVRGDRVERIAPLADDARDFAEEWIQSDWAFAASWTGKRSLKPVHAAMNRKSNFDYISVRSCGDRRTQIEVADPEKDDDVTFLIVGGEKDFRMFDVRKTALRECNGPEQFKSP